MHSNMDDRFIRRDQFSMEKILLLRQTVFHPLNPELIKNYYFFFPTAYATTSTSHPTSREKGGLGGYLQILLSDQHSDVIYTIPLHMGLGVYVWNMEKLETQPDIYEQNLPGNKVLMNRVI